MKAFVCVCLVALVLLMCSAPRTALAKGSMTKVKWNSMVAMAANSSSNSSTNATNHCERKTSCSGCSDYTDCVWCESKKECRKGGFFGADHSGSCSDWRWKQCSTDGTTILIASGVSIGVVLLLIVGVILYCCVCRRKRKLRTSYDTIADPEVLQQTRDEGDSDHGHGHPDKDGGETSYSATPMTDSHRAQMQSKYGVGSRSLEEARQRVDDRAKLLNDKK
jgi:hypothetical protein